MNEYRDHPRKPHWLIVLTAWAVLTLVPVSVTAHGPKPHTQKGLTPLAAVQKGLTLFDKLVSSGKLEETWETRLLGVTVTQGNRDGRRETIVRFNRDGQQPTAVYIFFDDKGNYSGSNFTGE